MPGGYKNLNGDDGNTFTSENQPINRGRKPSIRKQLREFIGQDGVLSIPRIDIVEMTEDEVKIKIPTQQAIVIKLMTCAIDGKPHDSLKAIQMIMDQLDGRPRQSTEMQEREPPPQVIEYNPYMETIGKKKIEEQRIQIEALTRELEELKETIEAVAKLDLV